MGDHNLLIDEHNAAQERVKERAQEIVKMFFLVSGGALAVCAGFFSAGVALPSETIFPVRGAWVSLTAGMIMIGFTLLLMLGQDVSFGNLNSRQIDTGEQSPDTSDWWDIGIWASGLIGFICFCIGMCFFTYAAWIYVTPTLVTS
ncbi:hypothetical protein PspS34_10070 [Pseudomonas sp. S34]|nr:hypothetical protein PspS34_10070 [Pseudomonas sp. S34]